MFDGVDGAARETAIRSLSVVLVAMTAADFDLYAHAMAAVLDLVFSAVADGTIRLGAYFLLTQVCVYGGSVIAQLSIGVCVHVWVGDRVVCCYPGGFHPAFW